MSSISQINVPGVEGSDYEVNLLTLFSLKALFSDKISDFQIESKNTKYGKFDDIILTLTPVEGEEIKIAFQLKHKMNVKVLKSEQLEHVKGDFSIHKYFESYRHEIKLKDKQNCHYVLFTNNKIDTNSFNSQGSKLSIVKDTSTISFNSLINICDPHKIQKFQNNKDANQNEFLNHFYLFNDQSNEKEVESEIQKMLLQSFGSNVIEKSASLLKLFRDLHKGRFIDKKMNKITLIYHLINLLIFPHSINLEHVRTGQESLCINFYNAVKLFDATHISCENMDFLKQNLKLINYVSEENLFRWAKCYKFIDGKMCLKDFEIKSDSKVLYHIDNQPIILNYSRDSAKAINCVIKLCIKKFPQIKFILAGREVDFALYKNDPDLKFSNLFENLSSLQMKDEAEYKQLINQFEVELNGRNLTRLTEFVSFNDQIANNMTTRLIVDSLNTGVIKFGDRSDDELPHYIPRQISGDVLSFRDIAEDENVLFIISCGRQLGKIKDFFKTNNLTSIDFDRVESKSDINTNIILTASESEITEDELNNKIEHSFRKTCYLELIVENGCFLGYFRYRKHNKNNLKKIVVEENEIQKYFQKSIEVLSASPGMGKTTLMKSISKSYPLNYACILLPLKDYSDFFKEKHSIVDLLNEYLNKKNVPANFQAHLASFIFQKCKVIFLCDGFDEIDRRCHNNLFKCVEEVRNNGHKVWISTRPNFSKLLRNHFDVNYLEIVELNENTQKEYIKNRLSESKNVSKIDKIITKIYEHIIIERHQTLLGTPLLLHMITEMIINNEEDLLNINNITDLFKYFFKGKFIHHINKHGPNTFVEEYFNLKLDSYKIPALKLFLETDLFNKLNLYMNVTQVENLRKSGDGLGVIVNVSGDRDNPNFSFFHNTYAEYFAAKWLAANYTRIPIEDRNFLLEDKYENLKFMFDIFMAEGCPAHIAVLCEDERRLAKCSKDEIVKTDKLNRSVLHIICASGDKFPSTGISYSNETYIVDRKVVMFRPKNRHQYAYKYLRNAKIPLLKRDSLFNKTALHYVTERFSIDMFSKIPQFEFFYIDRFFNNKILILYYSLKFGYRNLLQLDLIRSELETQTLTYIEPDSLEGKVNPIYIAAKYGQLEVLKYLYTFANLYETFNDPPLRVAAKQGHLHVVQELIKHNEDVNATNKDGRSPLWWAACQGHLDIVKELIAHRADVNAKNHSGGTPLQCAARKGHLNIVKELIAHNADVSATDKNGWTPLLVAANQGHLDVVKELMKHNVDVNVANKNKVTPLLLAACQGHLDVVRELIAHNANVNATDDIGENPLRAAANRGDLDIVKELIAHNVDVNATNKYGSTPLFVSAEQGHLDIVKELIKHNADVNAKDKDGRTPLLVAAKEGHFDIVKELIEHNADVNTTDNDRTNLLLVAASAGHLKIMKKLIAHNADVNAKDKYGRTPLLVAADAGHLKIVKKLIAYKGDINATDNDGETPLWVAAEKGHMDIVKELLAHKADMNARDKYGRTPLLVAVDAGHLKIVKKLIAHNADINARDNDGRTSLLVAAERGDLDIVKELITHKADINVGDNDGRTPLMIAADSVYPYLIKKFIAQNADVNATDNDGAAPLLRAAERGDLSIVKKLIAHKVDVNATDNNGRTSLWVAAEKGYIDIVKELIEHKADINATDKYGTTSLSAAANAGHLKIVKKLITNNADVKATDNNGEALLWIAAERGDLDIVKKLIALKVDINARDHEGKTLFWVAAENGHLDIIKELTKHNADINARDKDGRTPLRWAAGAGHLKIVKKLIAHKADVNAKDKYGRTPLLVAAGAGYLKIVKELIEHDADVNATDNDGDTPLCVAVKQRHHDIVIELIKHNADVNATYKYNKTPLMVAADPDNLETAKKLDNDTVTPLSVSEGQELDHHLENSNKIADVVKCFRYSAITKMFRSLSLSRYLRK